MAFSPDILNNYLDAQASAEDPLLADVSRETYLKVQMPHMCSGHVQGMFLEMISRMVRPRRILEIGTFTGYATICLAEGLAEDGFIDTIEVNAEMEEMLHQHFKSTNVEKKIRLHIGAAAQIIAAFDGKPFDLVFIDADKKNNLLYFDLILEKVRPGGLIIIDNVLWKGKVYGDEQNTDTRLIRELNDSITANTQVEKLILPVRDGILLIRKK